VRSVHEILSGQPWALTVKNGRASKLPVKLGLRGASQIEVVDGMQSGDIAIPQSSGVLIGQRVRPVLR
jgi:HlyD family secretion protein